MVGLQNDDVFKYANNDVLKNICERIAEERDSLTQYYKPTVLTEREKQMLRKA